MNYRKDNLFSNIIKVISQTSKRQFVIPILYFRELFGELRILDFLMKIDNLFSCIWLLGRKGTDTRINFILRRMKKHREENESTEDAVQSLLLDSVLRYDYVDENANTYMDVNELYDLFYHERWGSYHGVKINKTKYLLLKIDLLMSNRNTILQYDKRNSSVEHLLPRNPKFKDWSFSKDEHAEWHHRLGNLVLIDRKRNSSLSNNSFSVKKRKYAESIENRANTNSIFIKYDEWNLESLLENHERVVSMLVDYYESNSAESI